MTKLACMYRLDLHFDRRDNERRIFRAGPFGQLHSGGLPAVVDQLAVKRASALDPPGQLVAARIIAGWHITRRTLRCFAERLKRKEPVEHLLRISQYRSGSGADLLVGKISERL